MLRKLLLLLCFMALLVPAVFGQTGSLSGTITDAKTGKTVPTANVLLKQIQRGTASDKNGNYIINNIPVGSYTLRVTFVGYQAFSKRVKIGQGKNKLDVVLKPGAIGLDNLVVTGYSKEKESNLTSAISSVSAGEIQDIPVQNAEAVLQGRAAGARVTSTSGTPGSGFSIEIRGEGSINAGSTPLYIVDGIQISLNNENGANPSTPLDAIPPDQIESIQVLKDAAATAIYGSQGANGVVLINTKRGTQQTQVSASVTRGVVSYIKKNDYFDRDQFIKYFEAADQYDDPSLTKQQVEQSFRKEFLPAYGFDVSTPLNQLPNTDWFKYNFQQGVTQQYNMTISGGTEKNTYRVSGLYDNEDGYIRHNNYQNYVLNANFDQQVSSKFSMQENIKLSTQKTLGPCQDGFYINCPISQSAFTSPLAEPFHTVNGKKVISKDFPFIGALNNPQLQLFHRKRKSRVLQVLGSLSGTYDFTPYVSLHTQFSMDYRDSKEFFHRDNIISPSNNGSTSHNDRPVSNFQNSTTLNFDYALNEKNNLSGLVGFNYRRENVRGIFATGIGFPNPEFSVLNTAATPTGVGGFDNEFRRVGYIAQAKYNYNQTYFVKVSGNYGGSSRFGANDRFGFFPAGSVAWNIAHEDFFKSDKINTLKLRASYGISGNSLIGFYPALSLYGAGGSYLGATGLSPSQLANKDLTWEKNKQLDLALDIGFFKGRLTGSFDVYRNKHTDLLLGKPLPSSSGFGSITQNVGSVQDEGYEVQLNSVNIQSKDFQWRSTFNFSHEQEKILSLVGDEKALFPGGTQPDAIGHSADAWKVIRWAGTNPADGRPLWLDKDGNLTYHPVSDDRQYYGSSDIGFYGGFGNTFSYKGLSLNVFFNYQFGQLAIPQQITAFAINQLGSNKTNGIDVRLTEAWRKPGDLSQYPAPTRFFSYPGTDPYYTTATDKLYSSDYIRLKTVRLAYTLPKTLTQKFSVSSLQFFIVGNNIYTWTSYIGFDPEIAGDVTSASIPVPRNVQGGLRLKF